MKKNLRTFVTLSAVLLTTACTQTGLFVANIPTHFDAVSVKKDISYGHLPDQKLDIYAPKTGQNRKLDVIVFFYGGRWEGGSKDQYRFAGSALAEKGFVVVIPDYRKYPQVKFPAFIEDGAKSIAWVSDNISRYGGDAASINVAGHSAGAHIGALLTADKKYLAAEGKDRSKVIRNFAGLAGPYDFTPDEKDLVDMFGPPSRYPEMRPTTFADGKGPPMLLLHGADDNIVGLFNLEHLEARIKKNGGCVKSRIYPDIGHVAIVAALSWLGKNKAPVADDMASFFRHKECE